jgi:hypothetical protein
MATPKTPHVIHMSVKEWIEVQDNPRQRFSERRVKSAKHLLTPVPEHAIVHMGQAADGERWKFDGHTRALFWERGLAPAPKVLTVHVYPVLDAADAMEHYDRFDSRAAVKTGAHELQGAFNEHNCHPKSELLARGNIGNALRIADHLWEGKWATNRAPIGEIVARWKRPLRLLDSIDPHSPPRTHRFAGPVIVAALLTFRKYGNDAVPFWTQYNEEAGEKTAGFLDPVEALSQFMASVKVHMAIYPEIVGKALAAFEASLRGEKFGVANNRRLKAREAATFSSSRTAPGNIVEFSEGRYKVAAKRA